MAFGSYNRMGLVSRKAYLNPILSEKVDLSFVLECQLIYKGPCLEKVILRKCLSLNAASKPWVRNQEGQA
jgi:hypothetical protein